MLTCYKITKMSIFQMERLFRWHSIRTMQHSPTLYKRHVWVTPFVKRGVGIAHTQDLASLKHLNTSFLRPHAIVKITFTMCEIIIKITKHMIRHTGNKHNITIEKLHLCQLTIRKRNGCVTQSPTIC